MEQKTTREIECQTETLRIGGVSCWGAPYITAREMPVGRVQNRPHHGASRAELIRVGALHSVFKQLPGQRIHTNLMRAAAAFGFDVEGVAQP